MLLVTVIAEWHYILNVIYEMANALGIRVLFVKQKNTPVQVKGKVYENFVDENDGPTEL